MVSGHRKGSAIALGVGLGRVDLEEIRGEEELRMTFLLSWQEWSLASQGILAGAGVWDKTTSGEMEVGEEHLWDP